MSDFAAPLYVKQALWKNLSKHSIKKPRLRFMKYHNDLLQMEGRQLVDYASYLSGSQRSYVSLGDDILNEFYQEGWLKDLGLMVIAYWAPEFDPDHDCGAYFHHQYHLNCKIVNVCDCGSISALIALKLIHSYFLEGKIENALLLAFDQTTIPRAKNFAGHLPTQSSALGLYLTRQSSAANDVCILDVDFIADKELSKLLTGKNYIDFRINDDKTYNCTSSLAYIHQFLNSLIVQESPLETIVLDQDRESQQLIYFKIN